MPYFRNKSTGNRSVLDTPHKLQILSIQKLANRFGSCLSWGHGHWSISVRFETTMQRPVEASGVGLHSGVPVRIRILPRPVSTGIVFLRTDLDNFPIPASWRHVARVSYATSLMRQGVLISTTEHLLSVFYSMGIDNAYVEIDNLEVPILDGSGLPFVRLIEQAGIRQYRRKRRYLRIRRPISVEDKGKRISILPAEAFRLTCDTDYPGAGGPAVARTGSHARSAIAAEIAFARTFGWENDLDQMRNMGLIRGASPGKRRLLHQRRRHESRTACAPPTSAAATRRSI